MTDARSSRGSHEHGPQVVRAMEKPLPQPAHWFRGTYCHDCWHPRYLHVEDGPCSDVWQWGNALISCPCQRMTLTEEAHVG